jgi:hypothetical protein
MLYNAKRDLRLPKADDDAMLGFAAEDGVEPATVYRAAVREYIDRRQRTATMHAVVTINGVDISVRELLRVPVRIEPTTKTRRKRS